MKKILFVCTGNTCRSCMAEGILKDILRKNNKEDRFIVSSAGVYASGCEKASEYAVAVLKNEWDIDISDHISRKLKIEDLESADVVLTMTNGHKCVILNSLGKYQNKVYTLKEYLNCKDVDIFDPYGGTYDDYKLCAKEIRAQLEKLFERL